MMIPDSAICYVPGYGELTVGELRAQAEQKPQDCDSWEATLRMWERIALNPHERPWQSSGDTSKADAESHASGSTNAPQAGRSMSSGTATANVSNAA